MNRHATTRIEERLRSERPSTSVPAGLHDDIMRSVRAAIPRSEVASPSHERHWIAGLVPWLPAPVFGAVVLLAAFTAQKPDDRAAMNENHVPLAVVNEALELGVRISSSSPTAMMRPLSGEYERLAADIQTTAVYLLANIP